jgi:YHS domain-containing protein
MIKIPSKVIRVGLLGLLPVLMLGVMLATHALAGDKDKMVNTDESHVAIKGYDTVAYFTEHRAIRGKEEFVFSWEGVRWLFSSAANRDLFAADPERYIPQYGGH